MGNKIEQRIMNIMMTVFEIPDKEINEESSPDTIESWDSLKHMNLVVALEEEFGIFIEDDEIIEMLNFGLIVLIVKGKLESERL